MARVGGVTFPKALAQFEARAFDNGADNRADTADDIDLGVVERDAGRSKSLPPPTTTTTSSSSGEIDKATGRFTPNIDGPNPRAQAAAATTSATSTSSRRYTPEAADGKPAKPLRARAHLLVTVPLYMRWEAPGRTSGVTRQTATAPMSRAPIDRTSGQNVQRYSRLDADVREFHSFEAGGRTVSVSGAERGGVCARRVFVGGARRACAARRATQTSLARDLAPRFGASGGARTRSAELRRVRAIGECARAASRRRRFCRSSRCRCRRWSSTSPTSATWPAPTATSTAKTRSSIPRTASSRSS